MVSTDVFSILLVVENDIQEGAVHVQPAVVVNEAQFAEFIHEAAHAEVCGADHHGKRFLTDLRDQQPSASLTPIDGAESAIS